MDVITIYAGSRDNKTKGRKWLHSLLSTFSVSAVRRQAINSLRPSDAYVGLTVIGSDNCLSPGRHRAII